MRCHIVPRLGRVKLVDLTPRTINRAYAGMLEGGLAASKGTADQALWAVMAYCGLRLGEALALRRTDVDLDDRTLRDALLSSRVGTWQYPRNVQRRFRVMRARLDLPGTARLDMRRQGQRQAHTDPSRCPIQQPKPRGAPHDTDVPTRHRRGPRRRGRAPLH